MKLVDLLGIEWKGFKRSSMLGANIGTTIIIGIFILYFALSFVGLAFVSKDMIASFFPDAVFREIVVAFLILYFLIDVLTRFFLQKYISVEMRPYLVMPIKKSVISDYFLLRTLSSYFNYLPLFFIVPLFFIHLTQESMGVQVNYWLFAIGFILFNNYLVFWINKFLKIDSWVPALVLVTIVTLLFLGYKDYIPLLDWMTSVSKTILRYTVASIIPLVTSVFLYLFLRRDLTAALTLESATKSGSSVIVNPSFGFHRFFGAAGYIMDLEVKLILRSKRARTLFIFGFIFAFYPLIINGLGDFIYLDITFAMISTGSIMFSYGQLMLSWNSLHFDLLQTRRIAIRDIFLGKYYLLAGCCLVMVLISSFYMFLSVRFGLLVLLMSIYNMTFAIFLYMLLASYSSKKIDPTEGAMLNYGGFGIGHYLIAIPLFVIPFLMFGFGDMLAGFLGGVLAIFIPSILLLVFHRHAIDFCYQNFLRHRYRITAAFRKK